MVRISHKLIISMNPYQSRVYLALLHLSRGDDGFFEASIKEIKETAKTSEPTTRRVLKELVNNGVIEIQHSKGHTKNKYRMTHE